MKIEFVTNGDDQLMTLNMVLASKLRARPGCLKLSDLNIPPVLRK